MAASTLALLFALGGTAYAVNTVRSSDIVDGTIRTQDIGTGQVASIDIKNSGVGIADIFEDSLGRLSAVMAKVNTAGNTYFTRNVEGVTRVSQGTHVLQAQQNIEDCVVVGTALTPGNTVTASPNPPISVNLVVTDPAGNLVNDGFDVALFC